MAKKPTYSNYLLRTQKQRSRYFWCKRIVSLFGAGYAGQLAKPYIGTSDFYIVILIISFFLVYFTVAHFAALAICAIEEMFS